MLVKATAFPTIGGQVRAEAMRFGYGRGIYFFRILTPVYERISFAIALIEAETYNTK